LAMQPSQPQSVPIYVGNLAPDVTEGMLFEIFKRCGNVNSIRVCRDYITKRSLGYAYINFYTVFDAQRAIDTLNNTQIKGKFCRIMWSKRDPSERKNSKGNVFIKGLVPSVGPKELHDTFSQFGNILSCKVATTSNGESKGYGYVHFESADNALKAIEIVNGKKISNSIVTVGLFKSRQERSQNQGSSWTNVFVKNIDISTTEEEFSELFSKQGTITSFKLNTNEKFQKKFGFVNFETNKMAVDAINTLNNFDFKGNELFVTRHMKKFERYAQIRTDYELRRRENIKKYQGLNLYVKHIEDTVDENMLRKLFEQYGTISSLTIMKNERGISKGFGFVCFSKPEEAKNAKESIGINKITLDGCKKPLYVSYFESKDIRYNRLAQSNRNRARNYQQQQQQAYFNNNNYGGYQQYQGVNPQQQTKPQRNYTQQPVVQQTPQPIREDLSLKLYEIVNKYTSNSEQITGMILGAEGMTNESLQQLIQNEQNLIQLIKQAKEFWEQNSSN